MTLDLEARVRATLDWLVAGPATKERIVQDVLAAIPEPAPVVRSHRCANGVTIYYTVGAKMPWSSSSTFGQNEKLSGTAQTTTTDDDLAACLALRDGADAKDAQIGRCERKAVFCKSESAVVSAVFSLLHEIMPDWTHTHCGESSDVKAVAAIRALVIECDAKDVQIAALEERIENFVGITNAWKRDYDGEKLRGDRWMADAQKAEAELAALKAKASTWFSRDKAQAEASAARQNASLHPHEESVVPLYEAPPTPAERPVIGHSVIGARDGLDTTFTSRPGFSLATTIDAAQGWAQRHGGSVVELLRGDALGET